MSPRAPRRAELASLRARLLTSALLVLAASACEAELFPAFREAPQLGWLASGLDGPVRALVLDSDGALLAVGGPDEGPPFALRFAGTEVGALVVPGAEGPISSARRSGNALFLSGLGVLATGTATALRAIPVAPHLRLLDLSVRPGGEALAVGPGVALEASPSGEVRRLPLSDSASTALAAVFAAGEEWPVVAGSSGLLARLGPGGAFVPAGAPADVAFRSLDGRAGRVIAAGAGVEGRVFEIAEGLVDLSVGGMPPLHVVRLAPDGAVWVGGEDGFVARLEQGVWRAFELSVEGPVRALAPRSSRETWLAGGSSRGFVAWFTTSERP